jgi:hypothetical protein
LRSHRAAIRAQRSRVRRPGRKKGGHPCRHRVRYTTPAQTGNGCDQRGGPLPAPFWRI